jgi:hypothetical protein
LDKRGTARVWLGPVRGSRAEQRYKGVLFVVVLVRLVLLNKMIILLSS